MKNKSVDLSNISDAQYGERLQHYLDQFGGQDSKARMQIGDLAHQFVTAEMLDEIHTMLRYLIEK